MSCVTKPIELDSCKNWACQCLNAPLSSRPDHHAIRISTRATMARVVIGHTHTHTHITIAGSYDNKLPDGRGYWTTGNPDGSTSVTILVGECLALPRPANSSRERQWAEMIPTICCLGVFWAKVCLCRPTVANADISPPASDCR